MRIINALWLLLAMVIILVSGCANYVITVPLEEPLKPNAPFAVGNIGDELPIDIEDGDKPTLEDIDKFRQDIFDAIEKQNIYELLNSYEGEGNPYEVTGSLLDFKRGSGALRFLFGFGAGSAKLTVNLELVDLEQNRVVFAGNFKGTVTGGLESGREMYKRVAKDFAKELKKQLKKQLTR